MWVFTVYGFYSIASADKLGSHKIDPDRVMIRVRVRQHLENLQERFPFLAVHPIKEWETSDYRYRIVCSKGEWILALSEMAEEQEWSNFKNEVHANQVEVGEAYVTSLHRVWSVMLDLQPFRRFADRWWVSKKSKKKKGKKTRFQEQIDSWLGTVNTVPAPDPDLTPSCIELQSGMEEVPHDEQIGHCDADYVSDDGSGSGDGRRT